MSQRFYDKLNVANLIIIFFGFVSVNILGDYLDVQDSYSVNAPLRYFFLAYSIFLFFLNFKYYKISNINKIFFMLNSFWIIYLIRIFIDISFFDIYLPLNNPLINYWGFAFGVCFLPAFNIQFSSDKSIENFFKYLFPILLILSLFSIPNAQDSLMEYSRASGGLGLTSINYGQLGASLLLISIYKLTISKLSRINILLYVAGILVGLLIMGLSASKSPFVSSAAVIIIFLLSKFSFKRYLVVSGFLILIISGIQFFLSFIEKSGSALLARYNLFLEHGDENRIELIKDSFNEFINHPVFGNHFVLESGFSAGYYPHNIILESFMALGVFGGLLFLYILFNALKKSFQLLNKKSEYVWISILFFQYLFLAMLSGSLYNSFLFWSLLVLVLKVGQNKNLSSIESKVIT